MLHTFNRSDFAINADGVSFFEDVLYHSNIPEENYRFYDSITVDLDVLGVEDNMGAEYANEELAVTA